MESSIKVAKKTKKVQNYLYVAPTVIFIILIVIFPLVYSLGVSFTNTRLGRPSAFIGLANYGEALFDDHRFWSSVLITFKIGAPALVLEFAIGLLLATLLNRNIRGRIVFLSFLSLPVMIAAAVAGLTWRMLYAPKYGIEGGEVICEKKTSGSCGGSPS